MPDDRFGHLIVTGGTGYIGTRLVELAKAQGRRVTLLGRRLDSSSTRQVAWTLGDPFPQDAIDPDLPADRQAIVHLAHAWDGGEYQNVEGTHRLFVGAREAGLGGRIFISSQSAREACLNRYGRMKWHTEQLLVGDTSLRVGLVYGGPWTAMYRLLCRISALPLLPMVAPHRTVQPIHRDEVVQGILGAVDKQKTGTFALAGPMPIPFGEFLRSLAKAYYGRTLIILPVPLKLALIGCDMTAVVPLVPTIDRERVLGLVGTEPIASSKDLEELGVVVSPVAQRLALEPAGIRALLSEARAFLRYVLRKSPSPAMLARYARSWPEGAIARPHILLRWREPLALSSGLSLRLRVASRIAEASRQGEVALSHGTRSMRLMWLVGALSIEAVVLPTRLLASVFRR